jgi:hypothetical protein
VFCFYFSTTSSAEDVTTTRTKFISFENVLTSVKARTKTTLMKTTAACLAARYRTEDNANNDENRVSNFLFVCKWQTRTKAIYFCRSADDEEDDGRRRRRRHAGCDSCRDFVKVHM